ncbi:unnamed protein product [Malus baccata var. baccata]
MARTALCSQLLPSLLVTLKQRNHQQLMGVIATAGIVGLPNVGKSTLFNAVPNVGIVAVPDPRLTVLSDLSKSQRAVPACIELVDIAGLVKGASQGEGLGNKFLSNIREVDSILQDVRCFEDNDVVHVSGKVDPKADIDAINLELIFSDLDQIEKRMEKLKKGKEEMERSALDKIQNALMDGKPAQSVALTDLEKNAVKHLCLLTMKPIIYVANVAESDLAEPGLNPHVESELTELPYEERTEFLESLGVGESGLGNLIRATYSVLGLRTYFASREKVENSSSGVIHSDFEKGFIRAETVAYDDFVAAGSLAAARERGVLILIHGGDTWILRLKGQNYPRGTHELLRTSSGQSSINQIKSAQNRYLFKTYFIHPHQIFSTSEMCPGQKTRRGHIPWFTSTFNVPRKKRDINIEFVHSEYESFSPYLGFNIQTRRQHKQGDM